MRIAISGVNRGLGEGLARRALEDGEEILGFGRSAPSWADRGMSNFKFFESDMANHSALAELCSGLADSIDVLICNAATFANGAGAIEWFHPEAMREAFDVNTIAPLVMARSLKTNLEAGERRLIIFMSTGNASLHGNTTGTLLGYRLSKTALNQAARTLAAEWGPQRFTIVALNPGWVRTDMGGPDAELSVDEAADQVLNFVRVVSTSMDANGLFLNTDGSPIPW
jgi:NAD(P)-dependent dehydrogenase (short-subunit alcohol dehydrogenase family)